jgi:hypothetical protein
MSVKNCGMCGESIPSTQIICPHCAFTNEHPEHQEEALSHNDGLPPTPDTEDDLLTHPWPVVRHGLDTYKTGIMAKIIVLMGGSLLVFLATASRSYGAAQSMALVTVIGGVLTSLLMLAGLRKYARIPGTTGAKGGANLSKGTLFAQMLIELYVVAQIIFTHGSHWAARDFTRQQPYLEVIAGILGLISVMALLSSLNNVTRFCGRDQSDRISSLVLLLPVLTIAAFVVQNVISQGHIRSSFILGCVVTGLLVLAIITLVRFFSVVNHARKAMLPS